MELLRKKCDNELGTREQRGGFYDFRETEIWLFAKQDGKHGWAELAACLLQVFLLVLMKVLYWRSQNAKNQLLNCASQLAYKVHIQTEVYIQLNIWISPKVDQCILIDRDCLYKGNTWFGHWSVIWPWQDVVIIHDCWIAVVPIVQSCVIYQQDTGILDETKTKLLHPVHNSKLRNLSPKTIKSICWRIMQNFSSTTQILLWKCMLLSETDSQHRDW